MAQNDPGVTVSGMNRNVTASLLEQSLSAPTGPLDDLAADSEAADEDATAPLNREISELEARSIFPGVPLS
jgi:hypothetical protein